METERSMIRRAVCSDLLNEWQLCAHDLIIRVLMLNENQSITDRDNDTSLLQLILRKGGCRKSCTLDSITTMLKNMRSCNNSNCKVMVPTGKATSNVCKLTAHSHKEGLSLPIKGSFKELLGKRLTCSKIKYKNNFKLVVLDKFTMIS